MTDTIKVGYAPEFIQRAMDWAEVPVTVGQGHDGGHFTMDIIGVEETRESALVGKLTSAIIGLYLTHSPEYHSDLDPAGLERAGRVAEQRLGTRRSQTVEEIILAYLGRVG